MTEQDKLANQINDAMSVVIGSIITGVKDGATYRTLASRAIVLHTDLLVAVGTLDKDDAGSFQEFHAAMCIRLRNGVVTGDPAQAITDVLAAVHNLEEATEKMKDEEILSQDTFSE